MFRFLLVLALFALPALADDDDHHKGHRFYNDLSYLDLSPEQETRARELLIGYRKELRELREEEEREEEEREALFGADTFDKERYKALRLREMEAQVEVRARFLAALHALLTQEQRKRYFRTFLEHRELR